MKTPISLKLNSIRTVTALSVALTAVVSATSVKADISGFGGNGTGWTRNGSASITSDAALLTYTVNQAGSVFYNTSQNINQFSASFYYSAVNHGGGQTADGMVFVLQNQGTTALGAGGGYLGYTGIPQASGVALNLLQAGSVTRGTGYAATSVPYNYQSVAPVNLLAPVFVTLTYDGTTLTEVLQNPGTGATFSTAYTVDLAAAVGGNTAFIGFTGGTGLGASEQTISGFSYTVVPEPDLSLIALLGLALCLARRVRASRGTIPAGSSC